MPCVTSIERLAKEEGRVEGREEGSLVGRIQISQRVLREAQTSEDILLGLPREELRATAAQLEARL